MEYNPLQVLANEGPPKKNTAVNKIFRMSPPPQATLSPPHDMAHKTKTKNPKVAKCDFSQSQLFQTNWHPKSTGFRYYGCIWSCQNQNFHLPMSSLVLRGPQSHYREPKIEILCLCGASCAHVREGEGLSFFPKLAAQCMFLLRLLKSCLECALKVIS